MSDKKNSNFLPRRKLENDDHTKTLESDKPQQLQAHVLERTSSRVELHSMHYLSRVAFEISAPSITELTKLSSPGAAATR